MNTTNNYQKLAKCLSSILGNKNFYEHETESIQDTFVSGFTEIMRLSLDINIDEKRFEEFLEKTKKQPTTLDVAKFVAQTTETPKTYVLTNYYFAYFIKLFVENLDESKLPLIQEALDNQGIDEELLTDVVREYRGCFDLNTSLLHDI